DIEGQATLVGGEDGSFNQGARAKLLPEDLPAHAPSAQDREVLGLVVMLELRLDFFSHAWKLLAGKLRLIEHSHHLSVEIHQHLAGAHIDHNAADLRPGLERLDGLGSPP